MKTLVIGANGRLGRQFCELAHHEGLPLRAMIRHSDQQPWFRRHGIETVIADLEGNLRHAFRGCDQVVFMAGAGPGAGLDRTLRVELHGAVRAIDLAVELRLARFLMVSSLDAEAPLAAPDARCPGPIVRHAAERILHGAGVPWVILRPGQLTDAPATRLIATAARPGEGRELSRGNLAHALCYLVASRPLRGRTFPLVDGTSPLPMALV